MKKRLISLLTVIALLCIYIPVNASEAEQTKLQNLYYKLVHGSATIGYLGGSITDGACADPVDENSWRGLVGQWFCAQFPNAQITNINAGIGATGSYFGSYRAKDDVLYKEGYAAPDLLFIEYGVNDNYDMRSQAEIKMDYESIIMQAYMANPKMHIISLFTTDFDKKNYDYNELKWQREVAQHYNLPIIYMGKALYNKVVEENSGVAPSSTDNEVWKKYFFDLCHPTNEGHAVYAQEIEKFLQNELLSSDVSRNDTDYNDIVLPANTYSSYVKLNGDAITFSDAGFTADKLNGWTAGSAITTAYEGASFAFEFTGRSVGFWCHGIPNGGTASYKITSKTNSNVKYEGSKSMTKVYTGGLPWPCELEYGMPLDTYKVEVVVKKSNYGTSGNLQKIFIDGDVSTITQVDPPATVIVKDLPRVVTTDLINDVTRGGNLGVQTIDGKSGQLIVPYTNSEWEVDVNNYSLESSNICFPAYKYVTVDYYFDNPNNSTAAKEMAISIRQLNTPNFIWISDVTKTAEVKAPLVSNQWATATFDLSEFADWVTNNYPQNVLKHIAICPFGFTSTWSLTNGEKMYIASYSFRMEKEIPQVYYDDQHKPYVYVSNDGIVTVDDQKLGAFDSIAAGMQALGMEDGTIYIEGEITDFKDVNKRGKILIRGLGDSQASILANKITIPGRADFIEVKGGDLTFDYLTLKAPGGEDGIFANGNLLTFGEHFNTEPNGYNKLYVGFSIPYYYGSPTFREAKADNIIFNGGLFTYVASGSTYAGNHERCCTRIGTTNYTFNGGEFAEVWAGSRDSNYWGGSITKGDVNYTFNGGAVTDILRMGSYYSSQRIYGNITYTINGGIMNNINLIAGNYARNTEGAVDMAETIKTCATAIVNNSKLDANDNISTLTLGSVGKGLDMEGKEIYIINNYEKNTGTKINPQSTAEYKMHVSYGSATPVFEENENGYGGALIGFKLVPDTEGAVPYIGTQALTSNDGIYTIAENTSDIIEIVFVKDGELTVSAINFDETATAQIYNKTQSDVDCVLFISKYSKDTNAFISASTTKLTVKANTAETITSQQVTDDAFSYRAFLWEAGTIRPLTMNVSK